MYKVKLVSGAAMAGSVAIILCLTAYSDWDVFVVLIMPVTLAVAAILYPVMGRWWSEYRLLKACIAELRDDLYFLCDDTGMVDHGTGHKFHPVVWHLDTYRRTLNEVMSRSDFDWERLRSVVRYMSLDNRLALKFEREYPREVEKDKSRWDRRVHDALKRCEYQTDLRNELCKLLKEPGN